MPILVVLMLIAWIAAMFYPAIIAFRRKLKSRWIILILCLMPFFVITYFLALFWATAVDAETVK